MIEELVEIDTLVVELLAGPSSHLCQASNDKHVQLGLHSEMRVLNFDGHHFASLSILCLVNLGETCGAKCLFLDPFEICSDIALVVMLVRDLDGVEGDLWCLVL